MNQAFRPYILAVFGMTLSMPTFADNSKCWGIGQDDKSRPDISCKSLTEKHLFSLRYATRDEVIKFMNAQGRPADNNGIHYLSNAKGYGGDVNFYFRDGRVSVIDASITPPHESSQDIVFLWNADGYLCSDFPRSRQRCTTEQDR